MVDRRNHPCWDENIDAMHIPCYINALGFKVSSDAPDLSIDGLPVGFVAIRMLRCFAGINRETIHSDKPVALDLVALLVRP
jgi:hypothetical protein